MAGTPAHEWLEPRLAQLLRDAEAAGIARRVAVAVLTDLIDGSAFNTEGPLPDPDPSER